MEKDGETVYDLMIRIEKMSKFLAEWESLEPNPNSGKYPLETKTKAFKSPTKT